MVSLEMEQKELPMLLKYLKKKYKGAILIS